MVRTGTLIVLFRDKRRPACCVKNGRKGSVKAGGFGFVERPLGTSLIRKRYGCQDNGVRVQIG
ncbi:hypothetical protein HanRHA438_Chr15g0712121 [Helianthus annuus]|nr:hypothetical protein HanRHA438_Chr15g0712121 [Helianthus annuus]